MQPSVRLPSAAAASDELSEVGVALGVLEPAVLGPQAASRAMSRGATQARARGDTERVTKTVLPCLEESADAAAGLLASGSPRTSPSQVCSAQWHVDVALPGHSGEDHTGISPVSRALRLRGTVPASRCLR